MPPAVGWIGLGRIGTPMARRVLAAGWPLCVWARRREAAHKLLDQGARWMDSPEALARQSERLVTIVGDSDDVLEVHRRLLPSARSDAVLLEMSTAAPAIAARLKDRADATGTAVLDCPVTGGVSGAEQGKLTTFVGGSAAALETARPLLELMCQKIVHCGAHGAGYRMKLVNQTMMAGALFGLAQGAALAQQSGFDSGRVKEALASGTASGFLFNAYVERLIDGGGAVTFTLALLRKDLLLAREEAQAAGIDARLLEHMIEVVRTAIEQHGPDAGVQTLAATIRRATAA
jgi:3-hydroxyisobutyrate dehydrogenase-like beta-hydroxyacid dehydrogenase